MIVVTGAAGFIGSCIISMLNDLGFKYIIAVDQFGDPAKERNLVGKLIKKRVDRAAFFDWLPSHAQQVEFILHIGARTDTTEQNTEVLDRLNLNYSKKMWNACIEHYIPLIYASSAATYGNLPWGEPSIDDENNLEKLHPMNPYGQSKQDFDLWAMEQKEQPLYWAGLKFFNVYGPNEYHKGRMASVVYHAFNQIQQTDGMKLFRSHREGIANGQQSRDFIYVKDLLAIIWFLMQNRKHSGIYNVGTGTARSFMDLTKATFKAMKKEPAISFIDTPADIRDTYQYYTRAAMEKLQGIGYDKPFTSLEEGVHDYVTNYLTTTQYY